MVSKKKGRKTITIKVTSCHDCPYLREIDTSTWWDDNDITYKCRKSGKILYKGSDRLVVLSNEIPKDCPLR